MRIAVLGATSGMAKDLIRLLTAAGHDDWVLFARRQEPVVLWLEQAGLYGRHAVADFRAFGTGAPYNAILNFVGVGDPARLQAIGADIFDITLKFDTLALDYVRQHPACRYLFLSSGAVYGTSFSESVDENTKAVVAINAFQSQDWYTIAKLHAECRHRSLAHLPIMDIRVFNYFSHTQNLDTRFLIADVIRAIRTGTTLATSADNIVRDYLGPDDFSRLVALLLRSHAVNDVVDCYTRSPVDKMTLLMAMQEQFGLEYEVRNNHDAIRATGIKMNYFSKNHRAARYGYHPGNSSLENVMREAGLCLGT